MICQSCGKNTATTHVKTIVNGKLTEAHLCADCAREQGYGSLFGSGWDFGLGSMLGGLLGNSHSGRRREDAVQRCPKCEASFAEIAKTGKLGCAQCYTTFRRELIPTVQKLHGTTLHKGKTPTSSALRISEPAGQMVAVQETPLQEKKRLLQKAIEAQEFEQAALLRDEIKEMESHE